MTKWDDDPKLTEATGQTSGAAETGTLESGTRGGPPKVLKQVSPTAILWFKFDGLGKRIAVVSIADTIPGKNPPDIRWYRYREHWFTKGSFNLSALPTSVRLEQSGYKSDPNDTSGVDDEVDDLTSSSEWSCRFRAENLLYGQGGKLNHWTEDSPPPVASGSTRIGFKEQETGAFGVLLDLDSNGDVTHVTWLSDELIDTIPRATVDLTRDDCITASYYYRCPDPPCDCE